MATYLYSENVSPRDGFSQLELMRDDGSAMIIERGNAYDLSATELARARAYVVMTPYAGPPTNAEIVGNLLVNGVFSDGDVPAWSASVGAFTPETITGAGTKWKDPVATRADLDAIS